MLVQISLCATAGKTMKHIFDKALGRVVFTIYLASASSVSQIGA
jgi:hypothetical protein